MASTFPPRRENDLVIAVNRVVDKITPSPEDWGLNSSQVALLGSDVSEFVGFVDKCNDPVTRSPFNILSKSVSRKKMLKNLLALMKVVQAFPGTTDPMREELGLNIKKQPTQHGVPTVAPFVTIGERAGNVITAHLRSEASQSARKTKPVGVKSAFAFAYIGQEQSSDPNDYKFMGSSNRNTMKIGFPQDLPAGTTVWITIGWANERNQVGPLCQPVMTSIVGGNMQLQTPAMKIAA